MVLQDTKMLKLLHIKIQTKNNTLPMVKTGFKIFVG